MVSSKAATPDAYIAELPLERRALIGRVRDLVNDHLPDGYVERMSWGMISWEIPLETYPETYNGQPLVYELDENLKPIRHYYLGDQDAIAAAVAAVANQGKAK